MIEPNAGNLIDRMIDGDAVRYVRARDLPISVWPWDLDNFSPAGIRFIIGKLEKACRAQQNLARNFPWRYELNRHVALLAALKAEQIALDNSIEEAA